MRTVVEQRPAGYAEVDERDGLDLTHAPHPFDGCLSAFEHDVRHLAQPFRELGVFGNELRVAYRQCEMVGQMMLERSSSKTHTVEPGLIFQASYLKVCLLLGHRLRHHHRG